jgi:hypothetical protein
MYARFPGVVEAFLWREKPPPHGARNKMISHHAFLFIFVRITRIANSFRCFLAHAVT